MSSIKVEDFVVLNVIGSGSFGTCYRVRSKLDNTIYVWKAIDYGKMNENKKQLLVSEVNLLSELRHPNIVRYYDRILHKESTTLYIIMECCQGGDLASVISTCRRNDTIVEEGFIWQVLYQTGRALQACHSHLGNVTILHRDIKPANVFLDSDGNVKLGDFGLARILKNDSESYSETIVGTPYYMSPEVLKGGKYNRKSDIWALGCLVYELCSLSPPFHASNMTQLAYNIKNGRFNRIPSRYSDDLHKMIEFMLSVEHEFRPTIEMLLHHPTVVLHVSQRCISKFVPSKSIFVNTNDVFDGTTKNDITSLSSKMELISLYEREPQAVSEKTFNDKWLTRLEVLRSKEANLRAKEESLLNKERLLIKKEKQLQLLERIAKEKVLRAEVYLRQCKENKSVSSVAPRLNKIMQTIEEIDTSFSADPGDTSILPTSAKMNPKTIPKPNMFVRSASERRPKQVHFSNQITADKLQDIGGGIFVNKNDVLPICMKTHNGTTQHNLRTESKQLINNKVESFTDERAVWLENKRFVYNTVEKENNETTGISSFMTQGSSVNTGTIKKRSNKSVANILSRKSFISLR